MELRKASYLESVAIYKILAENKIKVTLTSDIEKLAVAYSDEITKNLREELEQYKKIELEWKDSKRIWIEMQTRLNDDLNQKDLQISRLVKESNAYSEAVYELDERTTALTKFISDHIVNYQTSELWAKEVKQEAEKLLKKYE